MTADDLYAADELRRLAGWNQTLEDWRRLLSLEPDGCFLGLQNNKVIGSVTTTTYGRELAWIGMMLVHPDHRKQGIGKILMSQAVNYLQARKVKCIKLDATPAGRPLYEKFGFLPESTLTRCERSADSRTAVQGNDIRNLRNLVDSDQAAIEQIDTAACGVSRSRLIESLVKQSCAALVWLDCGKVAGWGLMRAGTNADYLGPINCPSTDGAVSLLKGLLSAAQNRPVIWDVPGGNPAAVAAARQLDFECRRQLTRMRLGPEIVVLKPESQFAIAGPASG
ncbi:MAG TPA: GNAT family N-acetyltransferase [Candidatus Nitrosotalea sp.]|nr:GNAT family N-acetyltransferase [Candidatus Nitrosotalea sp.]